MPTPLPAPVIVVPGITGAQLRDTYCLPSSCVWEAVRRDYARVELHPDDPRYEAHEPTRIEADTLFEVAYRELIEELRYNLRSREDLPVPVFPFTYDWRQPLEDTEVRLGSFVDEVIERTRLLRHYVAQGYGENPQVNLVGHSMGGLIITGYLERLGTAARVGKVATIATPFQGSFEPVIKIATGTADLSMVEPGSREREAARLTPALYHLLPTFAGALEIEDPDAPSSLFEPSLWQAGVLATIQEYVRLHAVAPGRAADQARQAQAIFARLLDTARAYRARLAAFTLDKPGLTPQDWLCVVGVNAATRVRLRIRTVNNRHVFDLSSGYRMNRWEQTDDRRLTGDGAVPLEGALPTFLDPAHVICVVPDDFGYWELQDRVLTAVGGFHGLLPNMDMLHRLIVRHFTRRADPSHNTWGRPVPGVKDTEWQPPFELFRKS